jgi:site-specific recombinase XerD
MVLAKRKEESRIGFMRPQEKKSTSECIALFKEMLEGNNYSFQSIKAYVSDLGQFVEWLKLRRVDWDIPYRMQRIDIVGFINYLAGRKATAATRQRKLAAIRGYLEINV